MEKVALILTTFTIIVLITISILCICNIFILKGDLKLKAKEIYSYCLHFVSLVFSTISIVLCCPRVIDKDNLGFDYIGVIVGILSLLVAILIGWNIYTVVDFNKKVEITGEKYKAIEVESKKLKKDYQELKKQFLNMQSEMEFSLVFNYAMSIKSKISNEYVIDAYMDALNIAIKDNLSQDKVDTLVDCITETISIYCMETSRTKIPLLEGKKHFYHEVLSNVKTKNDNICFLRKSILDKSKERKAEYPRGYVRIMSDYNPDNQQS